MAALVTDLLVLLAVGHAVGATFFDVVSRWGPYGRAFGLVLMTGYLGLGASTAMAGRSPGKRLWGIEVAKLGGGQPAIGPALARASMISVPYLVNGWSAKVVLTTPPLAWALSLLVFGLVGSMLYLFLFNRTTGRAPHDLVCGTVVVRSGTAVPKSVPPVARFHWVALGCIALVLAVAGAGSGLFLKRRFGQALAPHAAFWAQLNADPRFFSVLVNHNTLYQGARATTLLTVQVWLKSGSIENSALTTELAAQSLEHYRSAEPDGLKIVLSKGYDLGVASWQVSHFDVATVQQWRARTAMPDSGSGAAPARDRRPGD